MSKKQTSKSFDDIKKEIQVVQTEMLQLEQKRIFLYEQLRLKCKHLKTYSNGYFCRECYCRLKPIQLPNLKD